MLYRDGFLYELMFEWSNVRKFKRLKLCIFELLKFSSAFTPYCIFACFSVYDANM